MTVYDTQLSMVRVTPNGDYRRICNAVVYNQRFTRLHIAAWGGPPNVPVDRAQVLSELRPGCTYRFVCLTVKPLKRSDMDVKFTFLYGGNSQAHWIKVNKTQTQILPC